MYEYSKQEVQEFLGSASNDINSLRQALKRRGYVVSVKKGTFNLDKELIDPLVAEFGFKPTRPETTRALLKAFHDFDGQLNMSWVEVANHIKETQGLDIHHSNLSRAYKELVDNEKANPIDRNIVLNDEGQPLTGEEKVAFDKYLMVLREWNDNMSITFQLALGKFGYKSVKVKEISAY